MTSVTYNSGTLNWNKLSRILSSFKNMSKFVNFSYNLTFGSGDLFGALHSCTMTVSGTKIKVHGI